MSESPFPTERPDTILLFDMDGVLLDPKAYHKALAETVRLLGQTLGYQDVRLSPGDIARFEAVGITSEWDSAAICTVLLLLPLWERFPDLKPPTSLVDYQIPQHDLAPPAWDAFFDNLEATENEEEPMLSVGELLSAGNHQERHINHILQHAHQINASLSHRVFQELVLGSQAFAETYALTPWLETKSYLRNYDRSNLSEARREMLVSWLGRAGNRAAIFTNRPSLPPSGDFGTPEAEIGARGVGLGDLPLVGYGDMAWLSAQRGVDLLRFRKPSPVHVLSALLRSLNLPSEEALRHAADLVLEKKMSPPWKALAGVDVVVFEDSTAGMKSALAAQEVLESLGVSIDLDLRGVSDSGTKRAALAAVGARVYATLGAALDNASVFLETPAPQLPRSPHLTIFYAGTQIPQPGYPATPSGMPKESGNTRSQARGKSAYFQTCD